jgi:hypothetical protein
MLIKDDSIQDACKEFMRLHHQRRLYSFYYFDEYYEPESTQWETVSRTEPFNADRDELSNRLRLLQLKTDLHQLPITLKLDKDPNFQRSLASYLKKTPPRMKIELPGTNEDSYNAYRGARLAACNNGDCDASFYRDFFKLELISIICGAVISYQLGYGLDRLKKIGDGRLRKVSKDIARNAEALLKKINQEGFAISSATHKEFLASLQRQDDEYLDYCPTRFESASQSEKIRIKLAVREMVLLSGRFEYRRSKYLSPPVFNGILYTLGIHERDETTLKRWLRDFRGIRSVVKDASYHPNPSNKAHVHETMLYSVIYK